MARRLRLFLTAVLVAVAGLVAAGPAATAETRPLVLDEPFGLALITKLNQERAKVGASALQVTQSANLYAQYWSAKTCDAGRNSDAFRELPAFGVFADDYDPTNHYDAVSVRPADDATPARVWDLWTRGGGQTDALLDLRWAYAGIAVVSGGPQCPESVRTTIILAQKVLWFGQRVSLRSDANSRFVSSEAGARPLIANRSTVGPWEQFDLVRTSATDVTLRSLSSGGYVSAEGEGWLPLVANRAAVGKWEQFTLVPNTDGTVSLMSRANLRWVSADDAGQSPLVANRTKIGAWESFEIRGPNGEPLLADSMQMG